MRSGSSQVQVFTARPASWAIAHEVLVHERVVGVDGDVAALGGPRRSGRAGPRPARAASRWRGRAPARARGRWWGGGSTRRGCGRRRARRARRAASTTASASCSVGSKSLSSGQFLISMFTTDSGAQTSRAVRQVGDRRPGRSANAVSTTTRAVGERVVVADSASWPSAVRRTSSSTPSAPWSTAPGRRRGCSRRSRRTRPGVRSRAWQMSPSMQQKVLAGVSASAATVSNAAAHVLCLFTVPWRHVKLVTNSS